MRKDLLRTLPPADCAISKLTKNKGSGWRKEIFFPNLLNGMPGFEASGDRHSEATQECVTCHLCTAIICCVEDPTGKLITTVIPIRLMDRPQKSAILSQPLPV